MGLVKAALGAASGVMGDQWKEYFYCSALPAEVLAVKGQKKVSGRSSNRHGTENVITDGSIVAVAEGQCALIVEQGKVVDLCAEAGEYTYNTGTQPSLLSKGLAKNIDEVFAEIGKRFSFGGQAATDQRIYYINTKELMGNKYGTPSPVPFRVVDQRAGIDIDVSIRCFGEYSYRIVNPILFYTNVCGNVENEYTRDALEGQMRTEMMTALQPAFARISEMGIRYSSLPGHTAELAEALNQELSEKWSKLRGIEIVSLGVSGVKASEEDEQMIKELQRSAAFMDPTRAAAHMVGAQASAMQAAASNTSAGPAMAFMGMNQAAAAGGINAQALYQMGAQQPAPAPAAPAAGSWSCSCGQTGNTGKFCTACGKPRPEAAGCAAAAHTTPANSARSAAGPARRPSARTAAGRPPTPRTRRSSAPSAASPSALERGPERWQKTPRITSARPVPARCGSTAPAASSAVITAARPTMSHR